jgi:antitoxin (DNA-binding transcriptional repressor) of toxin-antitoxin stability system
MSGPHRKRSRADDIVAREFYFARVVWFDKIAAIPYGQTYRTYVWEQRMTNEWTMPKNRCVSRNEARTNLSSIIENVRRTQKCVWIGSSEVSALSCVITLKEYEQGKQDQFADGISEDDVEIEELRKKWSHYRSIVEGSGKSRRILKRGAVVAVLVPTAVAYDRHIVAIRDAVSADIRNQVTLEVQQDEFFKVAKKTMREISKVKIELTGLRKEIDSLHVAFGSLREALPEREDVEHLNDLLQKMKTVLVPLWRKENGLPSVPIS